VLRRCWSLGPVPVFFSRSDMAQLWLTAWHLLALTGYLVIVISESVTRWPFAVMILSRTYHWETGVMLMWSTLLSRADLEKVAAGTVCLLVVLNHYMRALAGTVAHLATSTEEMR
jgi:hypothetical protein